MIAQIKAALAPRAYLLAIVWLIALFISITITHLPVSAIQQAVASQAGRVTGLNLTSVLEAMALLVRDILAVIFVLAISGGSGSRLTRRWLSGESPELPALQCLLGLGLVSSLVLAIGLLGLVPSPIIATVATLVAAAALFPDIKMWWLSLARGLINFFEPLPTSFDRLIRFAVIVLIFMGLILAAGPVTRWDALTYHVAAPAFFIKSGRVVAFAENHFFGFPELVEMLYFWLMLVARPNAAGLLHAAFGILGMLVLAGVVRRVGGTRLVWLSAAVVLVGDSMWQEWGIPYNDLALLGFVNAALFALFEWHDSGQSHPAWLVVTGLCVGFAMSTKYTAFASAIGIGCVVLWLSWRKPLRATGVEFGMVSVTAIITFSPWLIKNAVLYQNPVWPFLSSTGYFDKFDQFYYLRPGTGLDLVSTVLAPIQGAVFGKDGFAPYGSSMGSLLVPLLPLAFVGWSARSADERSLIKMLWMFALPVYLIWLVGVATSYYLVQTRLLFPIFPALAVVASVGASRLSELDLSMDLARVAKPITIIALLLSLVTSLAQFVSDNPLTVLLGLQPESDYLERTLGTYYAAMRAVSQLPQGSKVRFLWEPRTYYCETACLPDSLINQWWHDRQLEPDPHRIATEWRTQGLTHVFIWEDGLTFLTTDELEKKYELLSAQDLDALNTLRSSELTLIWQLTVPGQKFPSYSLYELKASP